MKLFGLFLMYFLTQTNTIKSTQLESTVKAYLKPQETVERLRVWDSATGKTIADSPAILHGHFISTNTLDLAVASSGVDETGEKSLTVRIMRPQSGGYKAVFEKTYPSSMLFGQEFKTAGFQSLRLPNQSLDSLVVITQIGASLGAKIQIWKWDGESFRNVVPENGSGYNFAISQGPTPKIVIGHKKSPDDSYAWPDTIFVWNGTDFSLQK